MSEISLTPYEKLQKSINRWPIRAPKTKNLLNLLEEIFTPEEAEIMSFFQRPRLDRVSPRKFVKRVLAETDKFTEEQILETLDSLAKRGMVYRTYKVLDDGKEIIRYGIWPMVIGIFEWFFARIGKNDGTYSEETIKKATKLFERYAHEGFIWEIGPSNYPWARILPSDQANKVVEVNEALGIDDPVVLPFEQVKAAIERSDGIAVIPCACRTEAKYRSDRPPCDKPVDVCMILGDIDYFKYAGLVIRELNKEEALDLLRKVEKKGLVHTTHNAQEMNFICNCCSCHCGILRGLVEFRNPRAFMKSNYVAAFNENECRQCYRCVEICPTKAIRHYIGHDDLDEVWTIDLDWCIGCGVCASNCPTKRIDLKKVRNEIPEETTEEAYMRMERERVH